jgi:hypothetical protein
VLGGKLGERVLSGFFVQLYFAQKPLTVLFIVWISQILSKIREIQTKDWQNPDRKLANIKKKYVFYCLDFTGFEFCGSTIQTKTVFCLDFT